VTALNRRDDLISEFGPDERFVLLIVLSKKALDGGLGIGD